MMVKKSKCGKNTDVSRGAKFVRRHRDAAKARRKINQNLPSGNHTVLL